MKQHYISKIIIAVLMVFGLTTISAQSSCDAAPVISEGSFVTEQIPIGSPATNLCFGQGAENSIWYQYQPSQTGNVLITSTIDPNVTDTRLSIYSGTCDSLLCIGFDDDSGVNYTSEISLFVSEGQPIYLEWDDRWTTSSFVFLVTFDFVNDIYGCTDLEAINFDPNANIDDGSCIYPCTTNTAIIDFEAGDEIYEIYWTISDEVGEIYAQGGYSEVSQAICLPDGCFSFNMYGVWDGGWNNTVAFINVNESDVIYTATLETEDMGSITFAVNVDECEDIVLPVYGCTDPEAYNYNSNATIDDGTCYYPFVCDGGVAAQLYVCAFQNGEQMNINITGDDGYSVFNQSSFGDNSIMYADICLQEGVCYTVDMLNNEGPFGWYDGYYWINLDGVTISTGTLQEGEEGESLLFSIDGTCGEVFGCTDWEAENYNPEATIDDGSCEYVIENDECANATPLTEDVLNFVNNQGAESDGLYGECWGFGNGEPEQNGVWYSFTTPEDPAQIIIEAVADGSFTLTDTQFGLYNECGGEMIECDGNAGEGLYSKFDFPCNYLEPNTEYFLLVDGWSSDQGTCLLTYTVIPGCDLIPGCTDPEALNYNPEATIDDGSCFYDEECDDNLISITFEEGQYAYEVSWAITDQFSDEVYMNGQFGNYTGCLPDGCYNLLMQDSYGDGWNGNIINIWVGGELLVQTTLVEGEWGVYEFGINALDCGLFIQGCTDPEAVNYDPDAVIDDGTCYYEQDCDQNSGQMVLLNGQSSFGGYGIVDEFGEEYYFGYVDGQDEVLQDLCLPDGCYQVCFYGDFAPFYGEVFIEIGGQVVLSDYFEGGTCHSFAVNAVCNGNEVYGCTDPVAINYNPNATIDDGSCYYEQDCDQNAGELVIYNGDSSFGGYGIISEFGEEYYFGSVDGIGEIVQELCLPNGCYQLCFYGDFAPFYGEAFIEIGDQEVFSGYFEGGFCYSFSINDDCNGNEVYGCTDPEAINFNANATIDDGSCFYVNAGDCEASFEIIEINELEDVVYILNTSSFGWGYEYFWDFGDGGTSTAPLPIHEYSEDGVYTVCLTVYCPDGEISTYCMDIEYIGGAPPGEIADGNASNGFTINIVDDPSIANGISDVELGSSLVVFPNPAVDNINVEFEMNADVEVTYSIYSVTGKELVSFSRIARAGENRITIPLESLSNGLYFMELSSGDGAVVKKFNVVR